MSDSWVTFDPALITSSAGAQWFKEVVTWYREPSNLAHGIRDAWPPQDMSKKDVAEMLHELAHLPDNEHGARILSSRPEFLAVAEQIFSKVMIIGPDDLRMRFNALLRSKRLFADPISRSVLAREKLHILIHLNSAPYVDLDPPQVLKKSLRDFFIAILAANPRYEGSLDNVHSDDNIEYILSTPTGSHTRNIKRMVTTTRVMMAREDPENKHLGGLGTVEVLRNHADSLPDEEEAFDRLLELAGFTDRGFAYEHTLFFDRNNIDELYLSTPTVHTKLHGIEIHYAEVEKTSLPDSHTSITDPLIFIHRGCILVVRDELDALPSLYRTGISPYIALLGVGHHLVPNKANNFTEAVHLMFALASLDDWTTKLEDVFATLFPRRFTSLIIPNIGAVPSASEKQNTSWTQALARHHIHNFVWPQELVARYHKLAERIANGYQDEARATFLIENVVPDALNRIADAFYSDAADEILSTCIHDDGIDEISTKKVFDETECSFDGLVSTSIAQYKSWLGKGSSAMATCVELINNMGKVVKAVHFQQAVARINGR